MPSFYRRACRYSDEYGHAYCYADKYTAAHADCFAYQPSCGMFH